MALRFADVSIPRMTALALAASLDKATAIDERYVVKTALGRAFGNDSIRPWRLLSSADGIYRVVGVVRDAENVRPNPDSRRLGILVELHDYDQADVMDLLVQATPVKRLSWNKPGTRERAGTSFVDISLSRDPETGALRRATGQDLRLAYMQWLVESLSDEPRTGMRVVDEPVILSTRPRQMLRKRRGTPLPTFTSCVEARVTVLVRDREVFEAFLKQGIKKMKDLGLGSMIPADFVEAIAA